MSTFTVKHPYNSPGHIALVEAFEDRKIVQHAGRSCVVLSRKTTGNAELVTSFELAYLANEQAERPGLVNTFTVTGLDAQARAKIVRGTPSCTQPDHRDRAIRWLTDLVNRHNYPLELPWRAEKISEGWHVHSSNDDKIDSTDTFTEEIVAAVNAAHLRHDIGAFDVDPSSRGAKGSTQTPDTRVVWSLTSDPANDERLDALDDARNRATDLHALDGTNGRRANDAAWSSAQVDEVARQLVHQFPTLSAYLKRLTVIIEDGLRMAARTVDTSTPSLERTEREPVAVVLGSADSLDLARVTSRVAVITHADATLWYTHDGCTIGRGGSSFALGISPATDAMLTAYFEPPQAAELRSVESLDAELRECGVALREADERNSSLRSERAKLEAAIKSFDVTLTDLTGHPRVMLRSLAHDIEEALQTLRSALR